MKHTLYSTRQTPVKEDNFKYQDDKLTANEWQIAEVIRNFLKAFKETTKRLESDNSTLCDALIGIDFCLGLYETAETEYKDHPVLGPMFNTGWETMEKYYILTDRTPAYSAAIILHPSRKWAWIEKQWEAKFIAPTKMLVLTLWISEYRPKASTDSTVFTASIPDPDENMFSRFIREEQEALQATAVADEYEYYCSSPVSPGITDPIAWWLEPAQQRQYPNLSRMALDILSIPAMSAGPERLFSGAKITITDRRNRLGAETINALMCLKSWFGVLDMEDAVLQLDIKIKELEVEVEREKKDAALFQYVDDMLAGSSGFELD